MDLGWVGQDQSPKSLVGGRRGRRLESQDGAQRLVHFQRRPVVPVGKGPKPWSHRMKRLLAAKAFPVPPSPVPTSPLGHTADSRAQALPLWLLPATVWCQWARLACPVLEASDLETPSVCAGLAGPRKNVWGRQHVPHSPPLLGGSGGPGPCRRSPAVNARALGGKGQGGCQPAVLFGTRGSTG